MADSERKRPVPKHMDPHYDKYKRSKKHEERLGARLGGKRLPKSGGVSWSKWDTSKSQGSNVTLNGDISTPDFHLEHKRTVAKSMSLAHEWLTKVRDGAQRAGKHPGVIITFEEPHKKPEDWALIPLEILELLLARTS